MAATLDTSICIIGAGPAGVVLGNILTDHKIDCIVVDQFGRKQIHERGRAGTLEHSTVETLTNHGLAQSIVENGMLSTTCEFRSTGPDESSSHVQFNYAQHSATMGRYIYPQSTIGDELIERFSAKGGLILFDHAATTVGQSKRQTLVELEHQTPSGSETLTIRAKFVVGCDGYHGITRQSVDPETISVFEKKFDYQWLTLVAEAAPLDRRVIYGIHPDGFAGHIPRTASATRYYLQISAGDDAEDWPDPKTWDAIEARLSSGARVLPRGSFSSKRTMTLRSFVAEPLRFGRIFLAGDAAHIVSPLGGKGMNMAIADAAELAATFATYFSSKKPLTYLDRYSRVRLPKIWQSVEFSNSLLGLTHSVDDPDSKLFFHKLNQSKLEQLERGGPFASHFARQFVGVA